MLGREEEIPGVLEGPDRDDGVDPLALGDAEQVDEARALGRPAGLRHLVGLHPVDLAPVAEEEDEGVVGGDGGDLHVVLFLGPHAHDAAPAAVLPAVGLQRQPLDVAVVGQRDHHLGVRDQVLHVQLGVLAGDPRPPRVAEPLLDADQLGLDDLEHLVLVAQNVLVLGDRLDQLFVLLVQLLALELGQPLQPHL